MMKTTKLWIFSFIFGLMATACFYFFLNSKEQPKPALAAGSTAEEKKNNTNTETNDQLKITDGKRAISIQVKDAQGISGYIKPGSYVDVLSNMTPPKGAPQTQEDDAKILLQNVKVLAVGTASDSAEERKKYKLVTLEVTPKEGLALGFASKFDLYLMLRNDGDRNIEATTHIRETDLHEGEFSK